MAIRPLDATASCYIKADMAEAGNELDRPDAGASAFD